MKVVKRLGWVVLFVLIGIQFVPVEYENPAENSLHTFESTMNPPTEIMSLMKKACYDCHTYQTKWPWYSKIAPVSWLIEHDVTEGRRHLNLSVWANYSVSKKVKKLSEIAGELNEKNMPMPIYITMHAEADLTDADRKKIANWVEDQSDKLDEKADAEADTDDNPIK